MATDLLARPGAAEVAIIGTGVQGRAHAHAIAATRELTGIRLAGRDLARTRAVAAELAGQLDVPVSAYDDVAAAVAGAAIVVTATTATETGAAPGVAGPGHAYQRGRRVRAGRQGTRYRDDGRGGRLRGQPRVGQERGGGLPDRGARGRGQPGPGRARRAAHRRRPGRADDGEITVFESLGLAAEDLAAASYLYEKASRLGAGTRR